MFFSSTRFTGDPAIEELLYTGHEDY